MDVLQYVPLKLVIGLSVVAVLYPTIWWWYLNSGGANQNNGCKDGKDDPS